MTHENKIIVVSGGTGYLGKKISELLTQNNFTVISFGKKDLDITDEKAVEKFARKINEQYGKIESIIHSAGTSLIRKPILSITNNEFQSQMQVSVTGAFNLFKHFKPYMSDNGSIIGITSSVIEDARHSVSGSYIPAKYALRGLLKALYKDLAGEARVYDISPVFMPGGLNSDIPQKALDFIIQKSKSDDITNPDEVAKKVLEAVNDTEGKFDGQIINVPDGEIKNL